MELKQTLVLSDVHLSHAHPEDPADPLWMRYRRRAHHPDDELAGLVDLILARPGTHPIELVFNGDVFDFDAPWVKDGTSSFDEFPPTDEGCTDQVRHILADHERFFHGVARLLGHGHTVTFLSGNHDLELYWPGVRRAIREELRGQLHRLPHQRECPSNGSAHCDCNDASDLDLRIRFRSWFHITSDRIYFEHGSQYDIHNAVRHPAVPLTKAGDRIHPVLGKLAFRRTGARMGYFNPYYEETFYMGLFGYLQHFAQFYAKSKHHIVRTWFMGAMSTIGEIWSHRHRDERIAEGRAAVRAELGQDLSDEAIDKTHALRASMAEDTMIPIFRELWIDRIALTSLVLLVALVAGLIGGAIAAGVAVAIGIALFVAYELLTPKPDIRTYDSAPLTVLSLFDIHNVRAICMGHTHRPFAQFSEKGLYANSGSWCPAFKDQQCTEPVLDGRPVLWLTTEGEDIYGGVYWWRNGSLVPGPETRLPPVRAVDTAPHLQPEGQVNDSAPPSPARAS